MVEDEETALVVIVIELFGSRSAPHRDKAQASFGSDESGDILLDTIR
jgi:hypothetical protein